MIARIGEQLHGQHRIYATSEIVGKLLAARHIELVFVLPDGKPQPVTIVVEHDAENGNATECIALGS